MVTALPSDQYYNMQMDTRTQTCQGYFSSFPKAWLGQALQFQPMLWSRKSVLSNYAALAHYDVKMITVPYMLFPLHQSEGPKAKRNQ